MLKSNARENQDLIAIFLLNSKKNGTYLEIGANHPITFSNTYLLEKEYEWAGVSIEKDNKLVKIFNEKRKNPCFCLDATTADYTEILNSQGLGPHIDFLQVDIEPPSNTLKALKRIDFNHFSFSFITFEHDFYRGGNKERLESRDIIQSYGYSLLISDVSHKGLIFEDWYIKEEKMPNDNWKRLLGDKLNMDSKSMCEKTRRIIQELDKK